MAARNAWACVYVVLLLCTTYFTEEEIFGASSQFCTSAILIKDELVAKVRTKKAADIHMRTF